MAWEHELQSWLGRIAPPDRQAMEEARKGLTRLTKPPGSLGRLEEIAVRLAGITGEEKPRIEKKHVVVMCGDHGVVEAGVSAFPQEVTALMMHNFARGGAAINVLARQAGAEVVVVDVGSKAKEIPAAVVSRKVRAGTANMVNGPAMSREEAVRALLVGVEVARELIGEGSTLLALGEMGIGNTTPSAAVAAVFLGEPDAGLIGRGTGIDDAGLFRKQEAIRRAIEVNRPNPADPLDVLAKVGGLELAGLAGVVIGAAAHRRPVIVDGVIAAASALIACRLQPLAAEYLLPSHLSEEPAHARILEAMGLKPFLLMQMRLGEGTGAVLAMPIVEAAARILSEMATFADLGLPNPV